MCTRLVKCRPTGQLDTLSADGVKQPRAGDSPQYATHLRGDSHATASATFLAEPRGTGLGLTYCGTHAACPHYRSRKP